MSRAYRRFGIGITLFVAAACWGWAYLAARQGYWVTVAIALAVSAMWFLSIRVLLASTDVVPQAELRAEGTLLKPDIRIDTAVRRITGTGAIATWAAVASFPYGAFYIPLLSELPESLFIIPLASFGAAVAFTWVWWRYKRQRGISLLLLTPDGLSFPSLARKHALKWDDFTEIRDELPTGEGRFWDPMVLMTKDGSYRALESPGIYTPEGTALVELVRFYWQHPERRHDLTTGHAITRLQQLQEIDLDTD